MLYASAVKVVDITAIPAIPGTITFRSCCLPWRIAPNSARNRSGSRKLKKAALGLRQKSFRSRRYWRQARVSASAILGLLAWSELVLGGRPPAIVGSPVGGQLQVHVLERGPRHG